MKNKIILSVLISLFAFQAYSQEKEYEWLIMGVPQYLFINGIRVDIDKNIKGTNKWISFSPQIYNAESPLDNELVYREYGLDKVAGVGLGVDFKRFFSGKSNIQGIYLATGAVYNFFNIDSYGYNYIEPNGDGKMELDYSNTSINTHINKMGVHTMLGYQAPIVRDFVIDMYIGFGIRYSLNNNSELTITDLSTFTGDYGYSGTNLIAGIRFGVGF